MCTSHQQYIQWLQIGCWPAYSMWIAPSRMHRVWWSTFRPRGMDGKRQAHWATHKSKEKVVKLLRRKDILRHRKLKSFEVGWKRQLIPVQWEYYRRKLHHRQLKVALQQVEKGWTNKDRKWAHSHHSKVNNDIYNDKAMRLRWCWCIFWVPLHRSIKNQTTTTQTGGCSCQC